MKTKILILSLFVLIVGVIGYQEVDSYLLNTKIENNPGNATALIIEHDIFTKRKKGIETLTYNFKYVFKVDEKEYRSHVALKNDSGKEALERGTFEVIYVKSNPEISRLKSGFVAGQSFKELLWMFAQLVLFAAVMAPLLGFIVALKFGWLNTGKIQQIESN